METPPKLLISKKEAAQVLSVSLRTIDHLISRGAVATVRIGKRVLVTNQSLNDLAESESSTSARTNSKVKHHFDESPENGSDDD
jgi:excisionase family DNA binding protein